ncbi:XTP/dITP diphosphatase [Heliobacterium gestii]|uniref:dITP/XTP pyrophosphatase n=1 Tax=Heliomicrobium gestii TaxID=2699 RepID=A0A845LAQ5_HELGE|nr:XTP/dITP diphosphatase [Heliomicrobium gestii]MBM7865344.1 XTP/dITP diphosphohydrolase [Heliomicrobium gestii]MZP41605.1 XTP/dITP diphosphatase [Heliomicrobium gestii]
MFTIILATQNMGKVREFEAMTQAHRPALPIQWLSLRDFPQITDLKETGDTFRDNALMKAEQVAKACGIPAMADDSGLAVDALGGAPGVYSARFAGEDKDDKRNNEKLLTLLKDIPAEERKARFVCVLALAMPDGQKFFAEGVCDGLIATEGRGDGGFGYDPLFYLPSYEKTFGELPAELKNKISHRASAMEKMFFLLRVLLFPEPEPITQPNL